MNMETIINNQNAEKELHAVGEEIDRLLTENKSVRVKVTRVNNGTLPMLRMWRGWMKIICDHMNAHGRRVPLYYDKQGNPSKEVRKLFPDEIHEQFSHICLGVDEEGTRYSWALSDGEHEGRKVASIGQKVHAMDRVLDWAMKEGLTLPVAKESEYTELKLKQCE